MIIERFDVDGLRPSTVPPTRNPTRWTMSDYDRRCRSARPVQLLMRETKFESPRFSRNATVVWV